MEISPQEHRKNTGKLTYRKQSWKFSPGALKKYRKFNGKKEKLEKDFLQRENKKRKPTHTRTLAHTQHHFSLPQQPVEKDSAVNYVSSCD